MATKKDLEEFATKEDLKKFSVKTFKTFATKEDVKELKQDIDGLKEQVQALTISIDRLVKAVENLRQEYFTIKSQLDRHENGLNSSLINWEYILNINLIFESLFGVAFSKSCFYFHHKKNTSFFVFFTSLFSL